MRSARWWTCLIVGVFAAAWVGCGEAEDEVSENGVKLEKLAWVQFQERLPNPQAKYTLVDAWSSSCGPCLENFPHLIEMHRKYAPKGLAVISLSLDDPADKAAMARAKKFLRDQNAVFTNVLLDVPNFSDGYEKLNIHVIPAVFLFGPDGKEVRRFTSNDPNHQFTYDEVEKAVAALLGEKS